jgi:hypothetical protein
MKENNNYTNLELYTFEKLNKEIYLRLDKCDFDIETKTQTFEIIFKVLDVINHYEWGWIQKWEYLKSYLAQLNSNYQNIIIGLSLEIANDRLETDNADTKILLSILSNLETEKNTKIDKELLEAKEIIGRDAKKIIEGYCRVRGLLMKESEVIDNFIDENYNEILKRVNPEKVIESNLDLKDKIKGYLINSIKHDIELDGGYRYLWKQEKPLIETDSQPFLKILLNKYCETMNVFIARENKIANGQVDFTIAQNSNKICIEVKNAHHPNIIKSINTQLPKYMEGEKTNFGLYVVLWFKSKDGFPFPEKYSTIEELEKELTKVKSKNIEVVIINCSKPISPSKIK